MIVNETALPPQGVGGRSLWGDLDAGHGGEVTKQGRFVGVSQEVARHLVRQVRTRVGGGHGCDGQAVRLRAGGARTSLRGGVTIVVVVLVVFFVDLVILTALRIVGVRELVLCRGDSGHLLRRSVAFVFFGTEAKNTLK